MRTGIGSALVLVLLAPSIARADAAEEARFHDELARGHYAEGRYEQAIREFFLEQRIAPNPRVALNIALCFDQLHRDDDAYLFFREYLAAGDEDAARRSQADAAIARLEPRVARVSVESNPPGASIFVDQRDHGSYGRTPRIVVVPPGSHTLVLELEGHVTTTVTVVAVRGADVAARASLERVLGGLEIASSAPGVALVRDAGGSTVAEGSSPLAAQLPPGDYEIELAAEGYQTWRGLVRVVAGETVRADAAPLPLPAPTGDLTVTASAAGALVELDGEPAGFAPTVLADVAVGAHRVRVSHGGLETWQGDVEIGSEARSWLTVSLVPPSETVRSPLTWVLGGVGIASIVAGGIFGGLALANQDRYANLEAAEMEYARGGFVPPRPMGSLGALRDQGLVYDTTTDVLLAIGLAAVAAAVVLFFATESTETRHSEGTFSEGEGE